MTFLEAALDILKREGRPLHFKELTERAMTKKLLTFVGRTPEVTMQTQLTAAVKKAPGNPFVRVKPGVFGLLRYPELTAEELKERDDKKRPGPRQPPGSGRQPPGAAGAHRGRRGYSRRERRRRGGRTTTSATRRADAHRQAVDGTAGDDANASETEATSGRKGAESEGAAGQPSASNSGATPDHGGHHDAHDDTHDEAPEPRAGGLSAAARAAALAETGVLEGDHDDVAGDDDEDDLATAGAPASGVASGSRDRDDLDGHRTRQVQRVRRRAAMISAKTKRTTTRTARVSK